MGDKRGRIIQAHFGQEGLVIRKSKLYDFAEYNNAQKHMELFLQHMTCKVQGPIVISDPPWNYRSKMKTQQVHHPEDQSEKPRDNLC